MAVEISNRQKTCKIDQKRLKKTTQKILTVLGCDDFTVSLSLVTSAEIAELNQRYRKKTGATDVLSFPQHPLIEGVEPVSYVRRLSADTPLLLGDVVICPDVAAVNAAEDGKSTADEIDFLLVHGILHLLGFDHEKADERNRMQKKEEEVWAAIRAETK